MDDQSRILVAKELLRMADEIMSADDEDDPKLAETLKLIRPQLMKLRSHGKRKLSQYNVDVIRPTATVADLVNAVNRVLQQVGSKK
jgi:hypothetical protein